jgi:hypothetical protein
MEASPPLVSLLNPPVSHLTRSSEIQDESTVQADILIVLGPALVRENTFFAFLFHGVLP